MCTCVSAAKFLRRIKLNVAVRDQFQRYFKQLWLDHLSQKYRKYISLLNPCMSNALCVICNTDMYRTQGVMYTTAQRFSSHKMYSIGSPTSHYEYLFSSKINRFADYTLCQSIIAAVCLSACRGVQHCTEDFKKKVKYESRWKTDRK